MKAGSASNRWTRWVIIGSRIGLITLILSGLAFAIMEIAARRMFGPDAAMDKVGMHLAAQGGALTRPRLSVNPAFVTDRHGILVGNRLVHGEMLNADGYRSPPFDEPANGRTTVLMLGDSFCWGDNAEPLSEAIPDLVRRAGFKVCNLGIGAVGAQQYRAEAEVYVPLLKPDVVCVMFYPGNDFEYEPPVIPGRPRVYVTESMVLSAVSPTGEAVGFDAAADAFMARYGPGLLPSLRRLAAQSTLYRVVNEITKEGPSHEERIAVALAALRAIRRVSEEHGARFLLFVLYVRPGTSDPSTYSEPTAAYLAEFLPHVLPPMDESCFPPFPEFHYNNKGHAQAAAFVLRVLQAPE